MLNSLQIISGFNVSVGDELLVLAQLSDRRRALGLQRMAAPVLAAEVGDGAAVPAQRSPPSAGELHVQPAGPVAAPLPARLHQALHCAAGPAGSHRQSCAAELDASAGSDSGLVHGGDGL